MERPDDLDAGVRLEVLCDQLPDDEPGLRCAAASIATALRGLHHSAGVELKRATLGSASAVVPGATVARAGLRTTPLGRRRRVELCSGKVARLSTRARHCAAIGFRSNVYLDINRFHMKCRPPTAHPRAPKRAH